LSTLGILASGRGSNCEAILRAASEGRLHPRVGLVLSDHPDAPVLAKARAFGVPARHLDPGRRGARLTPQAEADYVAALRDQGVEWVALAGFMRILGATFLDGFAGHVLNIHPSLLPAFPGLHAQRQAYDYGVKVAGCTVHFVDAGVDTGPIVLQAAVPVRDEDTVESLETRLLAQEHELYVKALNLVVSGRCRIEGRRVVIREDKENPAP
jgi:phosphoribosylglycinamide formyltransferase-1